MYSLTLETTVLCNMSCEYCYADKNSSLVEIPVDILLERSIELLLKEKKDLNDLVINYIGGEPLLKFKEIVKSVYMVKNLAKKNNWNISFTITTNGLLLDENIIDFFEKEKFSIQISLDGEEKSHDKYRHMNNGQSSYLAIKDKIDLLQKYQTKTKKDVQISMVINQTEISKIYSNLVHIYNLGFNHISTTIETYYKWDSSDLDIIEKEYRKFVLFMLEEYKKGIEIIFKPVMTEYKKHTLKYDCLYCFAGRNSIYVKSNGDISACSACQKENFIIGTIKEGFNEKYSGFQSYNPSYPTKCLKCNYFEQCLAKSCIAVNYEKSEDLWQASLEFCRLGIINMNLYDYFIKYLNLVREEKQCRNGEKNEK